MSRNILIVDDEPLARQVILEYIQKIDEDVSISEVDDAITAQKILTDLEIDIMYLDINMPMLTGLELAATDIGDTLTIFTTAYAEHAIEAFELAAFDYLLKPISFSRFQKSYHRATEHLKSDQSADNSWMMIKEGKRIYKVPYKEIFYLQAYGDYVKIFTVEKTYLMKTKLTTMDNVLPDSFVRSHRSYIISLEWISYLEGNHAVVNGEKIPISEGYKNELMRSL